MRGRFGECTIHFAYRDEFSLALLVLVTMQGFDFFAMNPWSLGKNRGKKLPKLKT
jgi:hypothetical protein